MINDILKENLVTIKDNKPVYLFLLKNKNGIEVKITNYGAKLISLLTPDKIGFVDDIVLGYDTVEEYFTGNPYFGAIIGRYANRINKGIFRIGETEYQLSKNHGENHLHGGNMGFQDVIWEVEKESFKKNTSVIFKYISIDGEEGYPGTLEVKVKYHLDQDNELSIEYFAHTDKATIVNLTHHSFFNLNGEGSGNILDHLLTINANKFAVIDNETLPTGEIRNIDNSPFDFRNPQTIGSRIHEESEQLRFANGYDHSFLIDNEDNSLSLASVAESEKTGRIMKVYTTHPVIHLYSGNYLNKKELGKGGGLYDKYAAFCLETQHFADSPNHRQFPNTILNPGEVYQYKTIYQFVTNK